MARNYRNRIEAVGRLLFNISRRAPASGFLNRVRKPGASQLRPMVFAINHRRYVVHSFASLGLLFLAGCVPQDSPAKLSPVLATENTPDPSAAAAAPQKETPAQPPLDPAVDVAGLLEQRLHPDQLRVGWIRLFDGQSMMGWRNASNANWHVDKGTLVATEGETGLLYTSVRFSDFELSVEFQATDRTNSGVFVRSPAKPTDPAKDCLELNIAPPDNPFPTGSIVGRAKVSEQIAEPESGEWHTMQALVDQRHVQVWIDGRLTADIMDTTEAKAGFIGLQFREGPIRFREIKVRPIGYILLPAKDLHDWNGVQGEAKAELTPNGSLMLTGGKGFIELLQPHANACIQFQVQTLAERVNSGLFFRCIPGEDMNGYECQIHHGYTEDRRRPVDSGMGAIFRRQPARAVLSEEGSPAFVTVIADGNQFSTWVHGVQVVEWQDTRAPSANPRKGLRLEEGTLMLQGHDPTCQVRFDGLSICPLP